MSLTQFLLDGVFPPVCIGCSAEGQWVCSQCLAEVTLVGEGIRPTDSALEAVLAVSSYQDPIMGGLIRSLKYQRALCLEAEALRSILTRFATEIDFGSLLKHALTMLVPLAMDPERERIRGLDHAFHIAQLVQNALFPEIPLVQALVRTKLVKTNASLASPEARALNIQGVFACRESVEGQSILLVDDVYTTGATLEEATRVLKQAGAAYVQACVLAQSIA